LGTADGKNNIFKVYRFYKKNAPKWITIKIWDLKKITGSPFGAFFFVKLHFRKKTFLLQSEAKSP
jgi:hypothetical protein